MHHSLPHRVNWLHLAAPLLVTLLICIPGMAMAQASPFLTGASSLQTNILILRCSGSENGGTLAIRLAAHRRPRSAAATGIARPGPRKRLGRPWRTPVAQHHP